MEEATSLLGNKAYNRLKWGVSIVLPAISALYFGLAQIWGLPGAEQVVGTIALLTTFLGVVLGISTKQYNASNMADGQIVVQEDDEGQTLSLRLEKTPDELSAMGVVSFKVIHE